MSSDVNFFPWATDSSLSSFETCQKGLNESTSGNDVVLCAPAGTGAAALVNNGSGAVLLLGSSGNGTLVGSTTGETYIIGGNPGANTIDGNDGQGYIQLRGNPNDALFNTENDTIAPN